MTPHKSWDMGPPEKEERGGASPGPEPHHRQLPAQYHETESHLHRKGAVDCDQYADGWRAGVVRGAVDALRMLGRRCCLDCAAEAEQLAGYYRGADQRRAS